MIIPVRCFTCGSVLADKWECYQKVSKILQDECDIKDGDTEKSAEGICLDILGVGNVCCRLHFLTNVDLADKL
jgi:DNA-directed RNA polymerase subunit N (RpoN/RPB10)